MSTQSPLKAKTQTQQKGLKIDSVGLTKMSKKGQKGSKSSESTKMVYFDRGGGGGGVCGGSKNGQKMTFFASMLMPKRGRYSPRHPRGVKKGGKSAPWSRFWAVSQGGPPI